MDARTVRAVYALGIVGFGIGALIRGSGRLAAGGDAAAWLTAIGGAMAVVVGIASYVLPEKLGTEEVRPGFAAAMAIAGAIYLGAVFFGV